MRTNRLLLLFLLAALPAGILAIFHLRFSTGDIYAPYSSLRTDPIGARVLFESLVRLRGIQPERNYRALPRLKVPGATVILAGVSPYDSMLEDAKEIEILEKLATPGARVIVALAPGLRPLGAGGSRRAPALTTRWGIRYLYLPSDDNSSFQRGWPLYFDQTGEWRIVRSEAGRAVILSRVFEKGEIVLVANSYPLSNQAMAGDRDSELIADLLGTPSRIVFDESHLGVVESGSVMGLARKYGLQGVIAGLLLLVVLYLWKSAAGFPPPVADAALPSAPAAGRDSFGGLVHLLRRNIPPAEIMDHCVREWRRSTTPSQAAGLKRIDSLAAEHKPPLQLYRLIQQTLGHKHTTT